MSFYLQPAKGKKRGHRDDTMERWERCARCEKYEEMIVIVIMVCDIVRNVVAVSPHMDMGSWYFTSAPGRGSRQCR